MDDELRERVAAAGEAAALFNALKHGSDPDVGAIMGPIMGENPEFRPHGDEIPGVLAPVVEEVGEMDEAARRERLGELAPDKLAELEADDEDDDRVLPDLPNAEDGEVVMRAAPNPNGPWHVGHARMPAVIGTYKERYDGEFICRFDDTDPETKRPDLDAYDAILDDIEYLGFEPDRVLYASDRLETYYEHARDLIDAGGAYTCSCSGDDFSELKNAGEACPHREKDAETVREEFAAMVDGEYGSGEMVLRVKTDIEHKNPALRDWVAFRMIDTPHPREAAADYRCWPMLDFQSGVDDHLTGVTHIIRGIDLQDSAKRQRFVYDYFDWEYPEVLHWGHVQVDEYDVTLSTSTIKGLIADGELTGWDDPRAPTIRSMRRRGLRGQALVDSMTELGMSTSDVDLAMSSVYAHNRDIVDDEADRYFFVRDRDDAPAVALPVVDGDAPAPAAGHPPLHPDHEDRGDREVPAGRVLVESPDLPSEGERVWLKGYGCVRYEGDELAFVDDGIEVVREGDVDVVHWAPAEEGLDTLLRTVDGDVRGIAEPALADVDPDTVVQFVRVGFARIDGFDPEATDEEDGPNGTEDLLAYYAHP
ncbi:glutamate--tRNA ligase [Halorubrum ezzemoulense]|uniref:Glutamate--tRNA ligase n=1 Tax=Halorubrum ezzemoulense TaxID=337243 RepID=A0ABT4Z3C3_HALEZ|nr:glutamate--tRNA ligase [Halorubrum ezzemoulense]MDB2243943.1 glutamate--tRNA ligase [Halorubrum ezzemoulense]MDB2252009.1 glutamate--tRNA ligase [Halorubrum ezzemoulense]MDB2277679.1 glutamate--tRNA ligase [Halorubrum ezzemoulense]MDB2284389.1 glutamate--tRNA ligase [Halorubrum ezzemoulense]MDB2289306.1 glutamate--tRNA ligase [Halorubrum ezzemoulense]